MMKIMIVAPYFYPKTGGLENYALNIARGLVNEGHQVTVVTSNSTASTTKKTIEEKIEKFKVIRLPIAFKFSNTPINPFWYFQLKHIIKKEKPDLINAHTPVPGLADMAIHAAKNIPTVLTCHAASLRKEGFVIHNLVTKLYEIVQRRTLKNATAIITVSDYAKDCLPEKYKNKCTIVYNAIDLNEVPKINVARKSNRFIFIGSLDKGHYWKGLGEVLKAIQITRKINSKVELVVIGDGNMRQQYQTEAKLLGIEKHVKFKGFIEGDEKYKLLKSSSAIIVYPTTDNDSFPTVFLEAWATRTPIISAKIGALSSLVQDNVTGLLVKPSNPVALAKSINVVLHNNRLTNSLSKNGISKITSNFTWSISVSSTTNLFKSITGKSLVYIANFSIDNNSAPSIHVFEVCNNLTRQGISVTLIAPGISNEIDVFFKFKALKVPELLRPITYQVRLFFALTRIILLNKPDYLYVRQESFMLVPALISRLLKITLVTEVNGLIEDQILSDNRLRFKPLWRKMRIFYFIEKIAYKNSQKIVVVTEGLKDNISAKYHIPKKKIVVIENGVNLSKLKPLGTSISSKKLTVGYVGSLVAWQGLEYIIQAIKIATAKVPNIRLIIAGEGPEETKLINLVNKLGVNAHISFLGLINHKDVPSVINSFDICIAYYTKDRDGMNSPFKVYEYLACGKPVIVSNVRGLSDKFANIANVAKAEDANDLAEKITTLIKNKGKQKDMSRAAIEYIANGHTWYDVSQKIAMTLEAVK